MDSVPLSAGSSHITQHVNHLRKMQKHLEFARTVLLHGVILFMDLRSSQSQGSPVRQQ